MMSCVVRVLPLEQTGKFHANKANNQEGRLTNATNSPPPCCVTHLQVFIVVYASI
jgi:hypothetical protein